MAERIASYVSIDGSAHACGVGACPCRVPTLSDPGETSGPWIDRIPPSRPSWRDRQYRELKKNFFSPPSKCPIDLFGPLANGRTLERLHVASLKASASIRSSLCKGLAFSLSASLISLHSTTAHRHCVAAALAERADTFKRAFAYQ